MRFLAGFQEMEHQMGRFGEGMLKGQERGMWGGSGRGGLLGMEPVPTQAY